MDYRPLSRRLIDWIEEALPEHSDGEEIVWDTAVTMLNTPQGAEAALYCAFWMPGSIVGTWVSVGFMLQNPPAIQQENVPDMVRQAVEGLRQARTAQLAQVQAQMAQNNGQGVPQGGLLQP